MMAEPIEFPVRPRADDAESESDDRREKRREPLPPSNEVHERVGDRVLIAAIEAVRRGLPPEEILKSLAQDHHVRLNRNELRLLLATRRGPDRRLTPR